MRNKPKPHGLSSHAFSRAVRLWHLFSSSSDWIIAMLMLIEKNAVFQFIKHVSACSNANLTYSCTYISHILIGSLMLINLWLFEMCKCSFTVLIVTDDDIWTCPNTFFKLKHVILDFCFASLLISRSIFMSVVIGQSLIYYHGLVRLNWKLPALLNI